jgi:hypothetical protein
VVRWSFSLLLCLQVLLSAGPAAARPPGDDAERQQRRAELRQQLEAERDRWRADGQRGGHRGGPPHGSLPPPGHGGHHGGARLSPEERRALRQDLREQRP